MKKELISLARKKPWNYETNAFIKKICDENREYQRKDNSISFYAFIIAK